MSEIERRFYIEKIDGSCVRLEPVHGSESLGARDTTIRAVIVEVVEATPSTAFWGTLGACNRFNLIVRKQG